MPKKVLERDDVREALASHNFGRFFYLARKWGGISYSRIADCTGMKPERVGLLARGNGSVATHAKILEIADGLHIPGILLGLAPRPWEAPSVAVRRPPTYSVGLETNERRIAAMVRRSVEFARAAQSGAIGPESMDQLHDDITQLATKFVTTSVFDMVGEIAELQDAVFSVIESRRHSVHISRDLHFAAAILTGLLAHSMKDLGRMTEATAFARAAHACGEAADHRGLMAWAHGELSLIAFRRGDFSVALRYADSATALATGGSPAIWVLALRARALGRLGNDGEARRVIAEVTQARSAYVPDDIDTIGGLFEFTEAKQGYYLAGALTDISGGASEAEDEALRALHYYLGIGTNYATIAGVRCEIASARVQLGDFQGAREALEPLLELPPARRVSGIIDSLGRVRVALAKAVTESPILADIDREIIDFCRFPTAAMMG